MAPHNVNLLFLLVTALTMASILISQANALDVSDKWCGQTSNKAICLSIVRADRRANLKTSANGIATILRDNALGTATATSAKIHRILGRGSNKHEIASLNSCSAGYDMATSSLRSADFRVMNRVTYITMVAAISDANDVPRDCELAFQEPPAVPSPISADNERLREICATTLEIINLAVCKSTSFC